jgi:AcrR family transcriptional regulator
MVGAVGAVRMPSAAPPPSLTPPCGYSAGIRQTVYAHYPSRPLLITAVIDRITAEAVAALDAADVAGGTVTEALLCWLDVTWRLLDRYPLLRHPSGVAANPTDSDRQHAPVVERLERLIRRGQDAGEFDRTVSPAWLVSATIALGHAAGADFAAGRMTATQAAAALRHSILRLYGVGEP